ncbi:DUF1724 domain-containing protein [Methanosarcina sp. Z-7115]|uniref:DUF1724 domain-containing protein n=1 Tax=Methanosarcina baikalica TaxID=3073890 RepID=A0ABU2D096_9EURY|nr:transcriptional regulator FilR1 domain-containing protein [Methanosarcina sp. Z-7115]MDR7665247.1 DUF1724 domain-containing protein [Methanosarcina sp. Z-7115]
MQPLVSIIDVFEDNFEYWTERDLHEIPPSFRKLIGELGIANFTVVDKFFMISLFPKNQKHFDRGSLISYEPSALLFGNELFNELLRSSTPITRVPSE